VKADAADPLSGRQFLAVGLNGFQNFIESCQRRGGAVNGDGVERCNAHMIVGIDEARNHCPSTRVEDLGAT
jgi:hypothetical protein